MFVGFVIAGAFRRATAVGATWANVGAGSVCGGRVFWFAGVAAGGASEFVAVGVAGVAAATAAFAAACLAALVAAAVSSVEALSFETGAGLATGASEFAATVGLVLSRRGVGWFCGTDGATG